MRKRRRRRRRGRTQKRRDEYENDVEGCFLDMYIIVAPCGARAGEYSKSCNIWVGIADGDGDLSVQDEPLPWLS